LFRALAQERRRRKGSHLLIQSVREAMRFHPDRAAALQQALAQQRPPPVRGGCGGSGCANALRHCALLAGLSGEVIPPVWSSDIGMMTMSLDMFVDLVKDICHQVKEA
jgi:hypothetical protein